MTIAWWLWAMIAAMGILLLLSVVLMLHEHGIYPLRATTRIVRRPWFETLLLLFCIGGLVHYGATKGTNGTENANQPRLTQQSNNPSGGSGFGSSAMSTNLCFTEIVPQSNSVSLSVAWPTNMFVEGTKLDFFAKFGTLTNEWVWLAAYDTVPLATNLKVEISCSTHVASSDVSAAMLFLVQDRSSCAATMSDTDWDGIPDVYELHNGTNPYVPDSGSVPRLTVGQNGAYASVKAALADSTAYSVVALGGETFVLPEPLVMPSHPVLVEGPNSGHAVIRSDAEVGAVMLTNGQDAQTMFRNLIVDLRAQRNFQAGFWIGGNTPWAGRGAAASFENVRVRANYPGVEHFGWLFYGNDGGPSCLRQCAMNAAGSTWAYGVLTYNAASNVIEDCAFLNMPTNAGETVALAGLSRETANAVTEVETAGKHPDLSWAGYPYVGSYSATADADGDGISDYDEIFRTDTDPWLADSDGDGIPDGEEDADGTDPRNLDSHGYRLAIAVKNADVLPNVTNYVFIGFGDGQWDEMVYSCRDEGGSTNFAWTVNDGSLLVSSFRDLNRNGTFDPDYDIVLSNQVSGMQAVVNLRFPFGDVDDDGVGDLRERLDDTDPYLKTSLKISRAVRISNTDGDSSITNYYAISQVQDPNEVQWTRMSLDSLSFGVSQKTMTGCLYALVYRDLNGNGVYDDGVDAFYGAKRFVSGSTAFDVPVGDADGDTIFDSHELREGTDPLNARSYCYQVSAKIADIFATTNQLTCNASFGTNEIMLANVVTNGEIAVSLGHHSTTKGEIVTLWFWDDANSNLVKDVDETYTSIAIRPQGHEVMYEGSPSISAFDEDRNGLLDWWEAQTGLAALSGSHKETDDNDHDGLINLHEYWAGTDPLTPDGSNTLLSVLSRSVDDRLKNATGDVLSIYSEYVQNGWRTNFISNTACWAAEIDMSCCSMWTDPSDSAFGPTTTPVTVISPRHVIYANHFDYKDGNTGLYAMPTGKIYYFRGKSGTIYSRHLIKKSGVANDIAVGLLDEELPTNDVSVAYILPPLYQRYIFNGEKLPVLLVDQQEMAYVGNCNKLSSNMSIAWTGIQWRNYYRKPQGAIGGDSSSPKFFVRENDLILLGVVHTAGAGNGAFLTEYKTQTESVMQRLLPSPVYGLREISLENYDDLKRNFQ